MATAATRVDKAGKTAAVWMRILTWDKVYTDRCLCKRVDFGSRCWTGCSSSVRQVEMGEVEGDNPSIVERKDRYIPKRADWLPTENPGKKDFKE